MRSFETYVGTQAERNLELEVLFKPLHRASTIRVLSPCMLPTLVIVVAYINC